MTADDTNPLVDDPAPLRHRAGEQAFRRPGVQARSDRPIGLIRRIGPGRLNARTPERLNAFLEVRNRIYARVFDRAWIATHMPDAEVRRQRVAYRRGLARAAAVAGVVLAAMGGLTVRAARSEARAEPEPCGRDERAAGHDWKGAGGAGDAAGRGAGALAAERPGARAERAARTGSGLKPGAP